MTCWASIQTQIFCKRVFEQWSFPKELMAELSNCRQIWAILFHTFSYRLCHKTFVFSLKVFSLSSLTCMLSSPNLDSPVWSAHSIRWWQSWRTWSFVDDVTGIKGRVGNQSQVWHWAGSSSFLAQMYHSLLHYLWGWIILLYMQCLLQLIQNIKKKIFLKWGLVYLPTLDALPMYLKIFFIYCIMQSILEIFFFFFTIR